MADEYRVLVTASRSWPWTIVVHAALGEAEMRAYRRGCRIITVVHGNARGGDKMADAWTLLLPPLPGMTRRPERHALTRDDWYPGGRFDPSAGVRRNGAMVGLGADECLAFADECRKSTCTRRKPHDSHGTADAIARAEAAGIPLRRYTP